MEAAGAGAERGSGGPSTTTAAVSRPRIAPSPITPPRAAREDRTKFPQAVPVAAAGKARTPSAAPWVTAVASVAAAGEAAMPPPAPGNSALPCRRGVRRRRRRRRRRFSRTWRWWRRRLCRGEGAGGAGSSAGGAGGGGGGLGGGIFSNGGTLTLTNDTFTANSSTGGQGGSASATAGQGLGGAVFSRNGSLTATFVTFSSNSSAQGGTDVYVLSDNSATSGSSAGIATANLVDDILGQSGTTTISDFVANSNGSAAAPSLTGSSNDVLSNNPTTGGLTGTGVTDITTGNPQLGPLADNGGPTQTMGLLGGSPALGTGIAVAGITTDQRGDPLAIPPSIGSTDLTVVSTPTLESIALTPDNTSLPAGQTEQFTAIGTLSDNTTENLTGQVTWASSDTTWATINSIGQATAGSPGSVTISAAFDGITVSTGLTVTAGVVLTSIMVTPANTSLRTGQTEQFTAIGTLSDNTTENLTGQVTWASSDNTWATINTTGLATAVSPGPVTISAAFDGITGSTGLSVTAAVVLTSITVTPASTSLLTGQTEQFTAIGTLSDNTTENLTGQVTWASSDTTWATINTTGLATAVSPGPVTISAAFDGITGSTGLTVTAAVVLTSITVTPANTSLRTGQTEQFTAIGNLSDNTTENLTGQVTWASSDTTWATINTTGLATAVSPGPVTISAAFDGITGSTGLTVVTSTPPPTPTQTVIISEQPLFGAS